LQSFNIYGDNKPVSYQVHNFYNINVGAEIYMAIASYNIS